MRFLKKWLSALRHHPRVEHLDWIWKRLGPAYLLLQGWKTHDLRDMALGRRSVRRLFNGTDSLRLLPGYRWYSGPYEPEVWSHLLSRVRPGDVVADVGAYIGLYTIALARRVGRGGQVLAFEPAPANFARLHKHVRFNHVGRRVRLIQAAAGSSSGSASLLPGPDPTQFHIGSAPAPASSTGATTAPSTCEVRTLSLDDAVGQGRLDILKIDVEGHEEEVLKGATRLLSGSQAPRLIYIEVHPYAWGALGTTSRSLLQRLADAGYQVTTIEGEPVHEIFEYGEVVASRLGHDGQKSEAGSGAGG